MVDFLVFKKVMFICERIFCFLIFLMLWCIVGIIFVSEKSWDFGDVGVMMVIVMVVIE